MPEVVLTDEERRLVLGWAHFCASESRLYDEDRPLVEKLGGVVDGHEVRDAEEARDA